VFLALFAYVRPARVVSYQLGALAFEAMVTQVDVLKEGLEQIEPWETNDTLHHTHTHT